MIIDWTVGEYAHLQAYYGVGFVLNWPGISSYITYVEQLTGNVIFTEALTSLVVLTESQAQDVILTETVSGKGVL